jgi:hypothetical protein
MNFIVYEVQKVTICIQFTSIICFYAYIVTFTKHANVSDLIFIANGIFTQRDK